MGGANGGARVVWRSNSHGERQRHNELENEGQNSRTGRDDFCHPRYGSDERIMPVISLFLCVLSQTMDSHQHGGDGVQLKSVQGARRSRRLEAERKQGVRALGRSCSRSSPSTPLSAPASSSFGVPLTRCVGLAQGSERGGGEEQSCQEAEWPYRGSS